MNPTHSHWRTAALPRRISRPWVVVGFVCLFVGWMVATLLDSKPIGLACHTAWFVGLWYWTQGISFRTWLKAKTASVSAVRRYEVDVVYRRKSVVTGVDRGALWFEDDLLRFEGARSVFALKPATAPVERDGTPLKGNRKALALCIETDAEPLKVNVTVHAVYDAEHKKANLSEWPDDLRNWTAQPPSTENEVLPPRDICPAFVLSQTVKDETFLAVAGSAFVVGATVVGTVLAVEHRFAWKALAAVFLSAVAVWLAFILFGDCRGRRLRRLFPDDPVDYMD